VNSPAAYSICGLITTTYASTSVGRVKCFVETFNGALRDECLNVHWFDSLDQAMQVIEAWRSDYNESRPHMARANVPPRAYACQARSNRLV